jgi:hypothetical protein
MTPNQLRAALARLLDGSRLPLTGVPLHASGIVKNPFTDDPAKMRDQADAPAAPMLPQHATSRPNRRVAGHERLTDALANLLGGHGVQRDAMFRSVTLIFNLANRRFPFPRGTGFGLAISKRFCQTSSTGM